MRNIYITFLLIFSAWATQAQPGYQGKRFSINYSLDALSALAGPTYHGKSIVNEDYPALNATHSVRLDYVLSRRASLGLTYGFIRTAVNTQSVDITQYPDDYDPYYYRYRDDALEPEYIEIFQRVHVHSIGVNYRMFGGSGGNLAPRGNYIDLETQALFWDYRYDSLNTSNNLQSGVSMLLGVGFGRQVVAFDKLLIDFGIRFRFIPGYLLAATRESSSDYNNYDPDAVAPPVDYTVDVLERLSRHQGINIRLGIGFLAF